MSGSPSGSGSLRIRTRNAGRVPTVAVRGWLWGGARIETIPGQALISGRLLAEGTQRRGFQQIAAEAEDRGMVLYSYGSAEAGGVVIDALAGDWQLALDWLVELLLEPAFPQERFEWLRRQALGELESYLDQPDVIAGRAFIQQLYGAHPYGRFLQGDPESLERLTLDDCAAFHARALELGGLVAVAGAIDEDAVVKHLKQRLGSRIGSGPPRAGNALPTVDAPQSVAEMRREVTLAGAEQAFLYLGHLTVPRRHEDLAALSVLGVILGAGAGLSGRLPLRIREHEGLAYHVDVSMASGAGLDPGRLAVFVGTAPATVEAAERAVREELDRLIEDGITDEELEDARSYLMGRDPFRRETARQWADILADATLYQVGSDRPEWVVERLGGLTRESVEAAARRWIRPEELRVTVGLPE